jgi:hypothetical protein
MMRVGVDPTSLEPAAQREFIAGGREWDDFIIDEDAGASMAGFCGKRPGRLNRPVTTHGTGARNLPSSHVLVVVRRAVLAEVLQLPGLFFSGLDVRLRLDAGEAAERLEAGVRAGAAAEDDGGA